MWNFWGNTLDTVLRDNKRRKSKYINAFCDDHRNKFYNQDIYKNIYDQYVKAFSQETSSCVDILKSFEITSLPSVVEVDRPLLTKPFSIQEIQSAIQ